MIFFEVIRHVQNIFDGLYFIIFQFGQHNVSPFYEMSFSLAIMLENCLGTSLKELNRSLLHVTCFVDRKSRYQVGY
jgi:hypothetical protein